MIYEHLIQRNSYAWEELAFPKHVQHLFLCISNKTNKQTLQDTHTISSQNVTSDDSNTIDLDSRGSTLVVFYIDIEILSAFNRLDGGVAFRKMIAVVNLGCNLMLENTSKVILAFRLAQVTLFNRREIVAKLIILDSKYGDTTRVLEIAIDFSGYALAIEILCILVFMQCCVYTFTA